MKYIIKEQKTLNFIKNPASGGIPLIEKPIKVNKKPKIGCEFFRTPRSLK